MLLSIAESRGLNPLAQECYFVKRWDRQKGQEVWSVQASIDAFRIKAEESGDYAGQDEPEYEYDEHGALLLARVRVYRHSVQGRAFCVGVAYWSEYVQTAKDGKPTRFWANMGRTMLAKCAEAIALRKAFPRSLAKIYTREEMMQADDPAQGPGFAKALPRQTTEIPVTQATSAADKTNRVLQLSEKMADCVEPTELEEFAAELRAIRDEKSANKDVLKNAAEIYKAKIAEFAA